MNDLDLRISRVNYWMRVFVPGTKKASGREIAGLRHQRHQSDVAREAALPSFALSVTLQICDDL